MVTIALYRRASETLVSVVNEQLPIRTYLDRQDTKLLRGTKFNKLGGVKSQPLIFGSSVAMVIVTKIKL